MGYSQLASHLASGFAGGLPDLLGREHKETFRTFMVVKAWVVVGMTYRSGSTPDLVFGHNISAQRRVER